MIVHILCRLGASVKWLPFMRIQFIIIQKTRGKYRKEILKRKVLSPSCNNLYSTIEFKMISLWNTEDQKVLAYFSFTMKARVGSFSWTYTELDGVTFRNAVIFIIVCVSNFKCLISLFPPFWAGKTFPFISCNCLFTWNLFPNKLWISMGLQLHILRMSCEMLYTNRIAG